LVAVPAAHALSTFVTGMDTRPSAHEGQYPFANDADLMSLTRIVEVEKVR
jgi:hypothetical protein